MKYVNMTPHSILVRKKDGSEFRIEPSGKVFRLEEVDEVVGSVDGVEVVERKFSVSSIPEEFNDPEAVVIVSLPALMALKTVGLKHEALIVAPDTGSGAIRDGEGRIIGTTRFIK